MGAAIALLGLTSCFDSAPVNTKTTIGLLALNDFHGQLEPPSITIPVLLDNDIVNIPAGGATYLASGIADFKSRYPHHLVVSAGDMISASPLISSLFLDEPTIYAFNAMGIDFNAVGNHEFDRGSQELLRIQHGGCAQFTLREPCLVRPHFPGANFTLLGANSIRLDNSPLLPAFGIKTFKNGNTQLRVGIVGITTKDTATSVNQAGIAGLQFIDEAHAANRAADELQRQGVDATVLVIHEGGYAAHRPLEKGCEGLSGNILPILERLSSAFSVVVSGHTHQAYVCDYQTKQGHSLLLTSAGEKGTLVTEIELEFTQHQLRQVRAQNRVIQGAAISLPNLTAPLNSRLTILSSTPEIDSIIDQYRLAADEFALRIVGFSASAVTRTENVHGESALGQLIADAQLYSANANSSGADLSFMNRGGLRANLQPDTQGTLTFGDIFSVLPFGNQLVKLTYSGADLYQILEEQFASGSNTLESPRILQVSRGVSYTLDLSQPVGERISEFFINETAVELTADYRVVTHTYLAEGGDNFLTFTKGRDRDWLMSDLDALEYYLAHHTQPNTVPEQRITLIRPQ